MAVRIQFTTLLIRIDRLRAVAADGVDLVEARWSPSWRDDHLLAVAFMDMGARDLAAELEAMGLTLRDTSSGTRVWQDICVVDYYDGPTNPCPWLEVDLARHVAWFKGSVPGAIAGPEHVHEEAPLRVSPAQFQQLLASQSAPAPTPAPPRKQDHEAILLPLTQQLAAELLRAVPQTAELDGLVFTAQFPRPGQAVTAGVLLHRLAGELRATWLTTITDEAHRLLDACSRHASGQPLTSIEIKIAGDGHCTTRFGIAPPLSSEALQEQLRRVYGSIPEAPAPAVPEARGLTGWVRSLFAARPKLHPHPALQHVPQLEPLSLFLDPLTGIDEGWDEPPPASTPATSQRPPNPAPAFDLSALQALEAARTGAAPAPAAAAPTRSGPHLAVPEREGLLLAEVRELERVSLAELHRRRPELRFDPLAEKLVRDLSAAGLGELEFGSWNGNVERLSLGVDGIASLDALLAALPPVLDALGGMGPIAGALGTRWPSQARDAGPVTIDDLRRYLVPDSPYGTRVFPCWLLDAPAHTTVGLDLTVGLPDGKPSFGWRVVVKLV